MIFVGAAVGLDPGAAELVDERNDLADFLRLAQLQRVGELAREEAVKIAQRGTKRRTDPMPKAGVELGQNIDAPRDLARGRTVISGIFRLADFVAGALGMFDQAIVEHDEQLPGRGVVNPAVDVIVAEALIHNHELAVKVLDEFEAIFHEAA